MAHGFMRCRNKRHEGLSKVRAPHGVVDIDVIHHLSSVESDSMLATCRSLACDCRSSVTNSGFDAETTGGGRMKIKEKEMKVSQSYRAALIAAHTIDSAPQKPKSALPGLMQRLSFAFLAFTLVIGAIGTA